MPKDKEPKNTAQGDPFSRVNLDKVKQLRPFKIDYSRVRKLEFIDKNNLKPQTFKEYLKLVPPKKLKATERARPAFARDLRHLKDFSPGLFLVKKVLVLVKHDLYPQIQASIDQ